MNMVQKSTKNFSKIKWVFKITKNALYVIVCFIGYILNKYFPENSDELSVGEKLIKSDSHLPPPCAHGKVFPSGMPPSMVKDIYGIEI